jgi:hypothetical protein
MNFERHHPNPQVDRNLARARDLRSVHLFTCLAAIAKFMSRALHFRREDSVPVRLELPVPPIGRQPI